MHRVKNAFAFSLPPLHLLMHNRLMANFQPVGHEGLLLERIAWLRCHHWLSLQRVQLFGEFAVLERLSMRAADLVKGNTDLGGGIILDSLAAGQRVRLVDLARALDAAIPNRVQVGLALTVPARHGAQLSVRPAGRRLFRNAAQSGDLFDLRQGFQVRLSESLGCEVL